MEKGKMTKEEFEKKYNKLTELKKIRLQNFMLNHKLSNILFIMAVVFFSTLGFLLIMPLISFMIISIIGFYKGLVIISFMGILFFLGNVINIYIMLKENLESKKRIDEFLNEK